MKTSAQFLENLKKACNYRFYEQFVEPFIKAVVAERDIELHAFQRKEDARIQELMNRELDIELSRKNKVELSKEEIMEVFRKISSL